MSPSRQNISTPLDSNLGRVGWVIIAAALCAYLGYKLQDLFEPFAYGHARWSDATAYWYGMMHLDLGLSGTLGMNVEGLTDGGSLLYYRSVGPLEGLVHAVILRFLDGEPWAVRLLPLVANLINLVLVAWIAIRWLGTKSVLYLVLLFVGLPFSLKYGTSNVGFLPFPLTLGLAGWLAYQYFLDNGRRSLLYLAMIFFAAGIGFNWHSGVMGLPVYLHMLFCGRTITWKLKHLTSFTVLVAGSVASILIWQGFATGDYLYPLTRFTERSVGLSPQGSEFTWLDLGARQSARVWQYFGPAVCVLSAYWLLGRLFFLHKWQTPDVWILGFWSTGLFYGVLVKQAAMMHDYLLLGFGPGFLLAATAGSIDLIDDGRAMFRTRSSLLKETGVALVALILTAHVLIATRSALIFERLEAEDLDGGEAQIAYFLRDTLTDDAILVADASSGYHTITLDEGKTFCNLRPHLAYLTRRPVRFVENSTELQKLLEEAQLSGRMVALVQLHYTEQAGTYQITADLIEKQIDFANKASVYVWGS